MTNFFRKRRDELGKTQRQIAESFEPAMTPATVSAWEMNVASPEMHRVDEVAKVYGVTRARILEAIHEVAVLRKAAASRA